MQSGCAEYSSGTSNIRYSEANMAWASTDTAMAARVFAHEIGHGLGLVHHGAPGESVMVEGNPYMGCDEVAEDVLSDPTSADGEDARGCAAAAHATYTLGPPPAYWWQQYDPCYELWFREEYWRCDAETCWADY